LIASLWILRPMRGGRKDGLQVRDRTVLGFGRFGMTPDQRAAAIARSRRAAIMCMAGAVACFMASLYFSDNTIRGPDASALKPVATEPEK